MTEEGSETKENYRFITLEGSHYDIGFQLGKKLKEDNEHYPNIVTDSFKPEKTGFNSLVEAHDFLEMYCPGIKEEMQGLADGFEVSLDRIIISKYMFHTERQNDCSQFIVLPSITKDSSIYIGRSYDYHPSDEDLILLRTKINGKYSHIGFSAQGIGRTEGINSEGLVVSMTGGPFDAPITKTKAFNYSIAIKTLLDNCKTVDEVIDLLLEMPVYSSTNYLISDKLGKSALVEGIDSNFAVKIVDEDSPDQYMIATNYYNHPEMTSYNKYVNPWMMSSSQTRYKTIESKIRSNMPEITKDLVFKILSQEMPEGICALFFSEWFGTLWSMLFDITKRSVDVCFGPPTHNPYHHFTMTEPTDDKEFIASLVNRKSSM
ncbi:MAG: C45 family autoproteolytic acyltransferase/hydrolase [Candidatus Hodarchaeales archaeon]|jgi:predicted choloylglycine hydrolase